MKKPSTQRPKGSLERFLQWVLALLICVNLLIVIPRNVPYIRLDLIHHSLPAISFDALRIDNLPFIRDIVQGVISHTSANAIKQNPIILNPSLMSTQIPSPPQLNSTPINSTTNIPTTRQTSINTANPTSTSAYAPTNTLTPAPPSPTLTAASIKMYYVAPNGDDSNPGTIDQPWRTLSPVHARDFLPGDVVHFSRGGVWSGGLVINDSGGEGNPITFTAYGSGNRPVFTNPGDAGSYTKAVEINADWVVVEGFLVQDAHEAGIFISNGSDHNIVRDIEATNVGIGIAIVGQHNLATRNYVHDLHMVVNTPGGNDDYGAVGIWMFNSNNEVSYNRMVNCKAPSYDYGVDGGAVEWFGDANNNYVHHNWATRCDGFLEAGGGSANNTVVAYNVSINNSLFSMIHLSGTFEGEVENFRIENNTIVETRTDDQAWAVLAFAGDPTKDTALVLNNIFWVEKGSGTWGGIQRVSDSPGFSHQNNIYHLIGEVMIGFDLAQGEEIADPLFAHLEGRDFHLQPGSPAIDSGIDLGYSLDFDDRSVPFGAAPDVGALEYRP